MQFDKQHGKNKTEKRVLQVSIRRLEIFEQRSEANTEDLLKIIFGGIWFLITVLI